MSKIVYLGNIDTKDRSFAYKEHYNKLTIGKIYNIIDGDNKFYEGFYRIINDKFEINWYQKEYFITLDKHRERKINMILS